jgi:hypothetical protein
MGDYPKAIDYFLAAERILAKAAIPNCEPVAQNLSLAYRKIGYPTLTNIAVSVSPGEQVWKQRAPSFETFHRPVSNE